MTVVPNLKKLIVAVCLFCGFLVSPGHAQSPEYKSAFEAYQKQDFVTAEDLWTTVAKQGDINAQYALGVMHLRNEAINSSAEKAFDWFSQAADKGHATAMFNVGVAYWEGTGVATDRQTALTWWERAAREGDSGAQFNLGLAYYIGEERNTDLEMAAKWIGLAADQNHPEAKRIMQVIAEENPDLANANTRKKLSPSQSTSGTQGNPEVTTVSQDPDTDDSAESDSQPQSTEQPVEEVSVASSSAASSTSSSNTSGSATSSSSASGSNASSAESESAPAAVSNDGYWKTKALNTPLYSQPANDSIIFSSLPNGTPIEIIERQGEWARVTLPGGLKLWIFAKFLTIEGNQGVVNATAVRARPQPSTNNTNSPPIGAYKRGDKVQILEQSGQWIRVRAPMHIGAWVRDRDIEQYDDTPEGRDRLWKLMISKGL